AGHCDDLVERPELAHIVAERDPVGSRADLVDAQHLLFHDASIDERAHARAERTARRERVVRLAAVLRVRERSADDPGDRGPALSEGGEVDEHVERGVPAPDDRDALARVPRAITAEDIGDAVVDPRCGVRLAARRRTARAEGIRDEVGPRCVDDRAREERLLTRGGAGADDERRIVAAARLQLVEAEPRDAHHLMTETEMRRDLGRRGERREVAVHELPPCRIAVTIRVVPARATQDLARRGVDVVLPRREHTDVAPAEHRRASTLSGLEDERLDAAPRELGGSREADRPRADDRDWKRLRVHGSSLWPSAAGQHRMDIDGCQYPNPSI